MKKAFLILLIFIFSSTAVLAAEVKKPKIGLKVNYSIASGSSRSFSDRYAWDPFLGYGMVIKIPAKDKWSLRFEAQSQNNTTFTGLTSEAWDLRLVPIELNIQNEINNFYFGGGINYSIWNVKLNNVALDSTNGFGWQFYLGLTDLFMDNVAMEAKVAYCTNAVQSSGSKTNLFGITGGLGILVYLF